ncbi:MAG TPA: DUF4132 domain-containing protein [Chitinolyticbacter sp.]|nr:DUF4132 domain-containing protein [Chitinolyticbacter sp.]
MPAHAFKLDLLQAHWPLLAEQLALASELDPRYAEYTAAHPELSMDFRRWADLCSEILADGEGTTLATAWLGRIAEQLPRSQLHRIVHLLALRIESFCLTHPAFERQSDGPRQRVIAVETRFDRQACLLELARQLIGELGEIDAAHEALAGWSLEYAMQQMACWAAGLRVASRPVNWARHAAADTDDFRALMGQITSGQLSFDEDGAWSPTTSLHALVFQPGTATHFVRRIRRGLSLAVEQGWLPCASIASFCENHRHLAPLELLSRTRQDWPAAYLPLRETLYEGLRLGLDAVAASPEHSSQLEISLSMLDYAETDNPWDRDTYFEIAGTTALFWYADRLEQAGDGATISPEWHQLAHVIALEQDETHAVLVRRLRNYSTSTLLQLLQPATWLTEPALFDALGQAHLEPLRAWVHRYRAEHDPESDPPFGTIAIEEVAPLLAALSPQDWDWLKQHYLPSDLAQLLAAIVGHGSAALEKSAMTKHAHLPIMALGLLPLPDGETRMDACRARYLQLKSLHDAATRYGAQRQANQRQAVQVGLANLAGNAGFDSPGELEWLIETAEGEALNEWLIGQTIGDYHVCISLEPGQPGLIVRNAKGKLLAQAPAAIKKDPVWLACKAQWEQLQQQRRRFVQVLESHLVRQTWLSPEQLEQAQQHPLAYALIKELVWGDEAGQYGAYRLGLLAHPDGFAEPAGRVRLAHPIEWLQGGTLARWQAWAIGCGMQQPIKQVFRELYVPTPAEIEAGVVSQRYAGRWVSTRPAQGIFKARGWRPSGWSQDAEHSRRLHGTLRAHIDFDFHHHYFTEVPEVVTAGVWFSEAGTPIALADVPPIAFSEGMRDLDLLIARALLHGADSYSSNESLTARLALISAIAPALGGERIRLANPHVHVDGKRANYRIHLGSGHIHIEPGAYLCVIPDWQSLPKKAVQLPFEDSDARTAEIISKIVLLLDDDQIQDEAILEQLQRSIAPA